MPKYPRRPSLERTERKKEPSQERAKRRVDAILDATFRLLETDGFDRLTTNRVAKAAGISVGSLYQYFPSREALIAAVVDRHSSQTVAETVALAATLGGKTMEESAMLMIDLHVQRCRSLRQIYSCVLPNIELVRRHATLELGTEKTAEIVAASLVGFRADVEAADLGLAGFLIVSAIDGILGRAVTAESDILDRPELVSELTAMVVGYLKLPRTPEAGGVAC